MTHTFAELEVSQQTVRRGHRNRGARWETAMQEVRVILPKGAPAAAHKWLRERLLDDFGGYTSFEVCGGWRDADGRDHLEPGVAFDVAAEDTPLTDWSLMYIVDGLFDRTNEQSIYVRGRGGEVKLFEREELKPERQQAA